ncbi:unnamed protein product [Tuber aestivum]|uniref:SAP domain-containing protein n=1 Tax=Tuber aestivum TaxID=59557 RepID=A0A292PX18_9PEZI|nr:unnamed protein product [Tuber aestivum]
MSALEHLRKQYTAAQLGTKGTKGQLATKCKESSPEGKDSPKCDPRLATEAEIGSSEGGKTEAKVADRPLREGSKLRGVRGEIIVGNRRGLDLAGLKDENVSQNHKLAALEDGHGQLNDPEYNRLTNRRVMIAVIVYLDLKTAWGSKVGTGRGEFCLVSGVGWDGVEERRGESDDGYGGVPAQEQEGLLFE